MFYKNILVLVKFLYIFFFIKDLISISCFYLNYLKYEYAKLKFYFLK